MERRIQVGHQVAATVQSLLNYLDQFAAFIHSPTVGLGTFVSDWVFRVSKPRHDFGG
jgi:hypothetical protein